MKNYSEYVTGDSVPMRAELRVGSVPEPVTPGTVVTAGFLASDGSGELVAGPWVVQSTTTGSDWLNGVVIAWVNGQDTVDLDPQTVILEVQIQKEDTVRTWRMEPRIKIVRGGLPND